MEKISLNEYAVHNIEPIYDKNSKILILGSFPSVKSREMSFYYAHPQNRFWKMMASIYNSKPLTSADEKKGFLNKHSLALWDVIASCNIMGSADISIKNAQPNNLKLIFDACDIKKVLLNGSAAYNQYKKYFADIGIPAVIMPSTSPANAKTSFDKLCEIWEQQLLY